MRTPTGSGSDDQSVDVVAAIAGLQGQIDDLTRAVRRQQEAIEAQQAALDDLRRTLAGLDGAANEGG